MVEEEATALHVDCSAVRAHPAGRAYEGVCVEIRRAPALESVCRMRGMGCWGKMRYSITCVPRTSARVAKHATCGAVCVNRMTIG